MPLNPLTSLFSGFGWVLGGVALLIILGLFALFRLVQAGKMKGR